MNKNYSHQLLWNRVLRFVRWHQQRVAWVGVLMGLLCQGLPAFEFSLFRHQASGNSHIESVTLDVEVKGKIVHCTMNLDIEVGDRERPVELLLLKDSSENESLLSQRTQIAKTIAMVPVMESVSGDGEVTVVDGRCMATNFKKKGLCHITLCYLLPTIPSGGELPKVMLNFPKSKHRFLNWHSDIPDIDISMKGVFRREVEHDARGSEVKALVMPNINWVSISWTPRLQQEGTEVVRYCESNGIVTVLSGVMRLDQLFSYTVSQGSALTTSLHVPKDWHVTRVDGTNVRSWKSVSLAEGELMTVIHNQAAKDNYLLRVVAEKVIPALPARMNVEPLTPQDCNRSSGYLCVGTDSTISLSLEETSSMTQVDASRFPRWKNNNEERPVPTRKLFCFHHFESSPAIKIGLKEIIPVMEVLSTQVLTLDEENARTSATLNITVKDAPLAELELLVDRRLSLVRLEGTFLKEDNYRLGELSADGRSRSIFIVPTQAYIGQVRVQLSLETGRSPLGPDAAQWSAIQVKDAKVQQGFAAISLSKGLDMDNLQEEGLQVVHGSSFPERVPSLFKSYRFRAVPCQLSFVVKKFPPRLHAEAFHLTSLGEGISYGSVAINYLVMDSSISSLRFYIPPQYENIEFVGADVSHWNRDGDDWIVHLSRKVRGAYSLAVVYSQRYDNGGQVMFGGVVCKGVDSITGSIVIASQLNLRMNSVEDGTNLIPLGQDEIPDYYLLLVNSPILESYKFSTQPGALVQKVDLYERGNLLPVLVDKAQIETTLSIGPDNSLQSLTKIRATVKNSQSQYLSFALPAAARLGTVTLTENEGEKARKITTSMDRGRLNIPLPRKRDPNNLCVVELEYGMVHQGLPGDTQKMQAPECNAMITQVDWRVKAPREWALVALSDHLEGATFGQQLLDRLAEMLSGALQNIFQDDLGWFILGAGLIALIIHIMSWRYSWCRKALTIFSLVLLLIMSVYMTMQSNLSPFEYSSSLSEMVVSGNLNDAKGIPLRISFVAVPDWQAGFATGAWQIPLILGLLGLVTIFFRSLRWFGSTLLTMAVMSLLMTFSLGALFILHLLTWGLPLGIGAIFIWRRFGNLQLRSAVLSSLILVLMVNGSLRAEAESLPDTPLYEQLQADILIQNDAAQVSLSIHLQGLPKGRYPLLNTAAILAVGQTFEKNVHIVIENNTHMLVLDRSSDEVLTVKFDVPIHLVRIGDGSRGRLILGLPASLVRKVHAQVALEALDLNIKGSVIVVQRTSEPQMESLDAVLPIKGDFDLTWEPRQRDRSQEKASYHARVVSTYRVEDGVMEGEHHIRLTMVTGELAKVSIGIPEYLSVYNVLAPGLTAWRYDADSHLLLVQVQPSITTSLDLLMRSQSSSLALPWNLSITPPWVPSAETNSLFSAIVHDDHLQVMVTNDPQRIANEDFLGLKTAVPSAEKLPRMAFRHSDHKDPIDIRILRVEPEMVVREEGSLSISDEHIRYNGELELAITRAGVFNIDLEWPADYDIESLTCPEASHWDEITRSPLRKVRVYFRNRLQGNTTLKFFLSRLPDEAKGLVEKPVIHVLGAERHRGTVHVSSEKGMRLTVEERSGVSEMKKQPILPGASGEVISFKLLSPDHRIRLHVETLQPRLEVRSLHVARINENTVRHQHTLIYDIQNAGVKVLHIHLPEGAESLVIDGPYLAKTIRHAENQNEWVLELNRKCLDEKYKLSVQYETRYAPEEDPSIAEVTPLGVDLWNAYVSVHRSGRIELTAVSIPVGMRSFDSRSIPADFSRDSLADAALCYFAVDPKDAFTVNVRRHESARTFQAEIVKTRMESFLSAEGTMLTMLEMDLVVGAKRNLTVWLPRSAVVWSLQVSGRPVVPAILEGEGEERAYLVPLDYAVGDEARCSINLSYINAATVFNGSGDHRLLGPRFDLPQADLRWTLYCPEAYQYKDFGGSLVLDESATILHLAPASDNIKSQVSALKIVKARQYQQLSNDFAEKGQQVQARKALEAAYNYSQSDVALNEDTRVQLHRLKRQQAVMGLVGARDALRYRGGKDEMSLVPANVSLSNFNMQQAEQVQNSLDLNDNRNLEKISLRMLEVQSSAELAPVQLEVKLPRRGTQLEFYRAMNVDENSPLSISFRSEQSWAPLPNYDFRLLALLFAASLVVVMAIRKRAERITE